jgi:hypothetical protein
MTLRASSLLDGTDAQPPATIASNAMNKLIGRIDSSVQ